jgi:hypothetical protein
MKNGIERQPNSDNRSTRRTIADNIYGISEAKGQFKLFINDFKNNNYGIQEKIFKLLKGKNRGPRGPQGKPGASTVEAQAAQKAAEAARDEAKNYAIRAEKAAGGVESTVKTTGVKRNEGQEMERSLNNFLNNPENSPKGGESIMKQENIKPYDQSNKDNVIFKKPLPQIIEEIGEMHQEFEKANEDAGISEDGAASYADLAGFHADRAGKAANRAEKAAKRAKNGGRKQWIPLSIFGTGILVGASILATRGCGPEIENNNNISIFTPKPSEAAGTPELAVVTTEMPKPSETTLPTKIPEVLKPEYGTPIALATGETRYIGKGTVISGDVKTNNVKYYDDLSNTGDIYVFTSDSYIRTEALYGASGRTGLKNQDEIEAVITQQAMATFGSIPEKNVIFVRNAQTGEIIKTIKR